MEEFDDRETARAFVRGKKVLAEMEAGTYKPPDSLMGRLTDFLLASYTPSFEEYLTQPVLFDYMSTPDDPALD